MSAGGLQRRGAAGTARGLAGGVQSAIRVSVETLT